MPQSPDGSVCQCCHPSVAIDSRGVIQVLFRNSLGGQRDMYLCSSTDGGQTFGKAIKLGQGSWNIDHCPMDGGNLAVGDRYEAEPQMPHQCCVALLHHFKSEHYWFGVTNPVGDLVLRTYPDQAGVPTSPTARTLGVEA